MKLVFLSNYLNNHQLPLCQALYRLHSSNFTFVATERVSEMRLQLGYPDMDRDYPFVLCAYADEAQRREAQQLTNDADVVILGSAPMSYLQTRLKAGKLTFLYSERLYKTGYQAWKLPVRLWRFWKHYGRYPSLYLLCASAYTAADFAKTCTFLNKAYQWGYFPAVQAYDSPPAKTPRSLLWAGRFLDWKHPEHAIEVARRLAAEGYDFRMTMLGNGPEWEAMQSLVKDLGLADRISLPGAVPSEAVRGYMEKAQIFLFTSDRNEGWGAVLNESMNSGCGVVACSAIGSVPFLLQDGQNGLTYPSRDVDALYARVKQLLDEPQTCQSLGQQAYETMATAWNAETAANRLLALCNAILSGDPRPNLYETGPCSKACILKDEI